MVVATAEEIDKQLDILRNSSATDDEILQALKFFIEQSNNEECQRIFMEEKVKVYQRAIESRPENSEIQKEGHVLLKVCGEKRVADPDNVPWLLLWVICLLTFFLSMSIGIALIIVEQERYHYISIAEQNPYVTQCTVMDSMLITSKGRGSYSHVIFSVDYTSNTGVNWTSKSAIAVVDIAYGGEGRTNAQSDLHSFPVGTVVSCFASGLVYNYTTQVANPLNQEVFSFAIFNFNMDDWQNLENSAHAMLWSGIAFWIIFVLSFCSITLWIVLVCKRIKKPTTQV